jgi:hypothetical protein
MARTVTITLSIREGTSVRVSGEPVEIDGWQLVLHRNPFEGGGDTDGPQRRHPWQLTEYASGLRFSYLGGKTRSGAIAEARSVASRCSTPKHRKLAALHPVLNDKTGVKFRTLLPPTLP